MQRKFDYSSVWADTQALLSAHREAIAAVAGVFLFLPDWASRLFIGKIAPSDATTPFEKIAEYQDFIASNWTILVPTGLLNLFGAVAVYTLLLRKDLASVGLALKHSLILLPIYFLVQLGGSLFTIAGFFVLILPGFYVVGRLAPLAAVTVAETDRGLSGIFSRAWQLTQGNGWAVFLLVFLVSLAAAIAVFVIGLIIALACRITFGAEGLPLLEHGVDAFLGAVTTTVMVSLSVAIYRALSSD